MPLLTPSSISPGFEKDGLFPHAFRSYFRGRHRIPERLAPYPFVRLGSVSEVEAFVDRFPE